MGLIEIKVIKQSSKIDIIINIQNNPNLKIEG